MQRHTRKWTPDLFNCYNSEVCREIDSGLPGRWAILHHKSNDWLAFLKVENAFIHLSPIFPLEQLLEPLKPKSIHVICHGPQTRISYGKPSSYEEKREVQNKREKAKKKDWAINYKKMWSSQGKRLNYMWFEDQ